MLGEPLLELDGLSMCSSSIGNVTYKSSLSNEHESILGDERNVFDRFCMRPDVEILRMLEFFFFLRGDERSDVVLTLAGLKHLGHFFNNPL